MSISIIAASRKIVTPPRCHAPGEAEYKYCMVNEDGTIAKWEIKDKFNRKVKGDANKQDDGDYGKIPGAPVAARAPPPGGPPVRADDAHGVHLGDAGHINMVRLLT